MESPRKIIVETDGASRGNPGLSGAGVIVKDERGHRIETIQKFLGVGTNNQAEYKALIEGLRAAQRHAPDEVTVQMDSELVVKQMTGQYRVRNPEIFALYSEAMELVAGFGSVKFVHVLRERNPGADRVANMAIDSRMVRGRGAVSDE